jgi:hypothetical protein
MKEEDIFPTPPEAPDPTLWQRVSGSPYFWWLVAMFLLGLLVILLPSQCSFDGLQFAQEEAEDLEQAPFVDQNEALQQRLDGFWYNKADDLPYTGIGVTFHQNGEKKTRTKFSEGLAIGLIEEWDDNGSLVGPQFKNEFKR